MLQQMIQSSGLTASSVSIECVLVVREEQPRLLLSQEQPQVQVLRKGKNQKQSYDDELQFMCHKTLLSKIPFLFQLKAVFDKRKRYRRKTYEWLQIKIMQFGQLCNRQAMENRFKQFRVQSRQEILSQIYGQETNKCSEQTVEKQMTEAFSVLLQNYHLDKSHPIVKEIAQIFNINLDSLQHLEPKERSRFLFDKIYHKMEEGFKIIDKVKDGDSAQNDKSNTKETNHFQWLGVKCKYAELRPVFQQILLEKVKLFDKQLTQLTDISSEIAFQNIDLATTAREGYDLGKTQTGLRGKTVSTTTLRHRKVHSNIEQQFTNVKIRDKSQFLLKKWTGDQQSEFQVKKSKFKSNLKINTIPVLFQFVKKYTQTVKARDNIYRKWQQREKLGITPEELRYLCATSVFLNNSLAKSQKQRIKNNIRSAGPNLVSRLQLNIAQKIIETYYMLMKRVADLRAKYYEELTLERKFEQKQSMLNEESKRSVQKKRVFFLKYKAMFERILNGEKMKIRLNSKVFKWVKFFSFKLKTAINKSKKKGKGEQVFSRLATQTGEGTPLYTLKMKYPSSKVIKREDQYSHRLKYRQYMPSERFHYDKKFEDSINKLNKTKLLQPHKGGFSRQLTGGPRNQRDYLMVDLSKKKVILSSPLIVKSVIKIQAKWKAVYGRKKFLQMIEEIREKRQQQFNAKIQSLSLIYPQGKKIYMKGVESRLKRINMKISNLIKPYIRNLRRPINLYTSFCVSKVTNLELKNKYLRNGAIRLGEFMKMVETNQFSLLKRSGIVVTAKQINDNSMNGGANAMWWAVSHSNLQLTTLFLQGGGDPNSKDNEDNTCLHVAVKNGAVPVIFLLLDYGADLNKKNNKKVTPLYHATKRMLKLLGLQQGVVGNGDKDNNSVYFRKTNHFQNMYADHYY